MANKSNLESLEDQRAKSTKNRIKKGLPLDYYDFVSKERNDLQEFIKERGYKDFLPLVHGTSKRNAEKIIQTGLKPRKETQMASAWRVGLESEVDKVYFARCQDSQLPHISAYNSAHKETDSVDVDKDTAYLLLENIEPYQNAMVEDEDWRKNKEIFIKRSMYDFDSNQFYRSKDGGGDFCYPRIPKEIIDYLDRSWYVCEKNNIGKTKNEQNRNTRFCFEQAFDNIPKGLTSIYMVQTLGITKSIEPKDLKMVSYKEHREISSQCRSKELNGGCDQKEQKLKRDYLNSIRDYIQFKYWDYRTEELCGNGDKEKMKYFCPKYPQWYLGNREDHRHKIDTMTKAKEQEIGKEINVRLEKSRNDLLEYINETKMKPKYHKSEVLEDIEYDWD